MSTEPLIGYSHLHATGVRTFNLLISYSEGANHAVEEISKGVTLTVIKSNLDGADLESLANFRKNILPSLLAHPHVASAYIIGTGEEAIPLHKIIGELLALNSATEYLSINNGTDEAMAVKIATSGATDLSTQSLPGLGEIPSPKVILGYEVEPEVLPLVNSQLKANGIEPDVRKFSSDPHADLLAWMLEGVHIIVSFTPADLYPVGTLLTPVINISSGSDFHSKFKGDFDISEMDPGERIVEEILGVVSRVRTFSEYTKTVLPVISMPLRSSNSAKKICLVSTNEALGSMARDIAAHFENLDYLGHVDNWKSLPINEGLFMVLTTGSNSEVRFLENAPDNAQVFNLGEAGSLGSLAEATAQFLTSQK